MALNSIEVQRLNSRYTTLTRKRVQHFVCPITLRDECGAPLCDGHVLSQKIKTASRATVVQYKDVENYFGKTVEPELESFLNVPVSTPKELIGKARTVEITGPNGEKMEAFWGNKKSRERFQQVDLYNADGSTFSSPFLRTHRLEGARYSQMPVEWTIRVNTPSIDAAFLKAGFLAMFRMFDYQWLLMPEGDKVRRHLAGYFNAKASREDAAGYFEDFRRSNWIAFNPHADTMPDTLEGGSLLYHYAEGDRTNGLLFGVSCLFRCNGFLTAVTLPCSNRDGHYFPGFEYYREFVQTHSLPHAVYFGRFSGTHLEIADEPLRLKMADKYPPDGAAHQISPPGV